MNSFRLTPAALDDLDDIFSYTTAQFGDDQAARIEASLFATFAQLADFPGMGHQRADLTKRPFLFFLSDPFLIAYEPDGDPVLIHGVLHGARNLRPLLKRRLV